MLSPCLAALMLLAQTNAPGARGAEMRVSARVVRSVEVSVGQSAAAPALQVRTATGAVWSVPLDAIARTAGVVVTPYARDPRYVVVTIFADAPSAPARPGSEAP